MKVKVYTETPDSIERAGYCELKEVEVSTADLIAELEKRRHELCPKCANGKSVLCVECVWAGVYRAYRKDDNFKDKK